VDREPADLPRYIISVAARLVGVTPGRLRSFERAGLLSPARTKGNIRLYSEADIALARHIVTLTEQGVNLAGVRLILQTLSPRSHDQEKNTNPQK